MNTWDKVRRWLLRKIAGNDLVVLNAHIDISRTGPLITHRWEDTCYFVDDNFIEGIYIPDDCDPTIDIPETVALKLHVN